MLYFPAVPVLSSPVLAGMGEPFPPAAVLCSSPAQVEPYLPYEYTCEGMLERIHAYIQHQVGTVPVLLGKGPLAHGGSWGGHKAKMLGGWRREAGAGAASSPSILLCPIPTTTPFPFGH